ncbi:MAG TPA: hypothetical protein VLC71_06035 [Thermomonas sp.]|nr:hypothetical protein [Thermomonas sp.]
MNRADNLARIERCRRILEGTETVPAAELQQFPQLVAAEYARAEARRAPTPQLDLAEAA